MAAARWTLPILFIFMPCVLADGWDDFTNNLATDLAPLITLFGEQVTKQFLSESLGILDNLIFALAPLGILTAVVSVIRVWGTSSLRAFIGRAQEGPGDAEQELLSCVSETTAEMFNDGGISRVFGRPEILEVVTWEEDAGPKDPDRPSSAVACLRDAVRKGVWDFQNPPDRIEEDPLELDIPNLSLNKGIKRRSKLWFYTAAVVGCILQIGVMVFGALTVYLFPSKFKKDGKAVPAYAFPLFFCGTALLSGGMFCCAFIIERSSFEYYLRPNKPSRVYWLQPGGQKVGDQVFGAFLAVREGSNGRATTDMEYIKSVRSPEYYGSRPLLYVAVSFSLVGFVCQFVGLRGLHSSVTLALLGSTLVMAIVRTCLRTQRMDLRDNLLTNEERTLTSCNKQELDCFAFHLEHVKSFRVLAGSTAGSSTIQSQHSSTETLVPSTPTATNLECLGRRVLKTRAHLAALTDGHSKDPDVAWNDLPVRKMALHLKSTIETTMDLLAGWSNKRLDAFQFRIRIECQPLDGKTCSPLTEEYPIQLQRTGDTLRWTVDGRELEAVLGLWTWSLLKSDEGLFRPGQPLSRLIGPDPQDAMTEETDLYYHKWIFRQTEAKMVSATMIPASHELFGCHRDTLAGDMEILVVKTPNPLCTMAAQDLYIHFLNAALETLEELGGEVDILPSSSNTFVAHSSRIEELARCFESSRLGSKEDALLCIVPTLKRKGLLPELSAHLGTIRQRVERYIENGEWKEAMSMLRWLCERSEGAEFEHSVIEFGYLCLRAMLHPDNQICCEGVAEVFGALKGDFRQQYFKNIGNPRPSGWMNSPPRSDWWDRFTKELGWLTYHVTEGRFEQGVFEKYGAIDDSAYSLSTGLVDGSPDLAMQGQHALLQWLKNDDIASSHCEMSPEEVQLSFEWAVQNNYEALLQWLMVRWAEVGAQHPAFLQTVLVWAAKRESGVAIQTLRCHGANLNVCDTLGKTALLQVVAEENERAVRVMLENGVDVEATGNNKVTPLMFAADGENLGIFRLLLQHGACIDSRDIEGSTPLIWAAQANRLDAVRILLSMGADIETAGNDRRTPVIQAVTQNHPQMVQLLLERGAQVDAQSDDGRTALMFAAHQNLGPIMQILLDAGASIYRKDNSERTALDWARIMQHKEAIEILEGAHQKVGNI
ncbi:hypothetical protein VTN02DRAFT_3604 [Thermoascus thermophilus]